jgi:hypothetical protein
MSFGQHSDGIDANSSALRILYEGCKQTYGTNLTGDSFTQTNPPTVRTPGTISDRLSAHPPNGILSGSVAFTRPDEGNGFIGGPTSVDPASGKVRPLGLYLNSANDFDYANKPAQASNKGVYINGSLGVSLYETYVLDGVNAGDPLDWQIGDWIYAIRNGYITNLDDADNCLEAALGYDVTTMGLVRIVPDSHHPDLVFENPV